MRQIKRVFNCWQSHKKNWVRRNLTQQVRWQFGFFSQVFNKKSMACWMKCNLWFSRKAGLLLGKIRPQPLFLVSLVRNVCNAMIFLLNVFTENCSADRNLSVVATIGKIDMVVFNVFKSVFPEQLHLLTVSAYQVSVPKNQLEFWTIDWQSISKKNVDWENDWWNEPIVWAELRLELRGRSILYALFGWLHP